MRFILLIQYLRAKLSILSLIMLFFFIGYTQGQIQSELTSDTKVSAYSQDTQIESLFIEALKYKYNGDYEIAKEYLNKILELDPRADGAYFELANIELESIVNNKNLYANTGLPLAKYYLLQAIYLNPTNLDYLEIFSEVALAVGDMEGAYTALASYTLLLPENEDVYYKIVDILVKEEKYERALEAINKLLKIKGDDSRALNVKVNLYVVLGRIDAAIHIQEKLIGLEPYYLEHYVRLVELLESQNTEIYIDKRDVLIQTMSERFPDSVKVLLKLCEINYEAGKRDIAFGYLERYVKLSDVPFQHKIDTILNYVDRYNKEEDLDYWIKILDYCEHLEVQNSTLYLIYGYILTNKGEYEEAEKRYEKALSINQNNFNTWRLFILLKNYKGDYEGVKALCRRALVLYPVQGILYYFLGSAQLRLGELENAIKSLKTYIDFGDEDTENISRAYGIMGEIFNEMKEYTLSDQAMEQSIKIDPMNAITMNNYAYFLALRSTNLERAQLLSERSLEIFPNNASFLDTLAWILFKKKKYKKSLAWIKKALEYDEGDSAVLWEHYGDILFHLKKKKEAIKMWKKAYEMDNSNKTLEKKIELGRYIY